MSIQINSRIAIPESELEFRFTRSGGPGGQNVNKISSRVELLFPLVASSSLTEDEKKLVSAKLKSRIDSDGTLHVDSQESRSQYQNRAIVVEKFAALLRTALTIQRKRHATKPTRSSKQTRIVAKKTLGVKKKLRGKVHPGDD